MRQFFREYMRDCKRCGKCYRTDKRTSKFCLDCYKPNYQHKNEDFGANTKENLREKERLAKKKYYEANKEKWKGYKKNWNKKHQK